MQNCMTSCSGTHIQYTDLKHTFMNVPIVVIVIWLLTTRGPQSVAISPVLFLSWKCISSVLLGIPHIRWTNSCFAGFCIPPSCAAYLPLWLVIIQRMSHYSFSCLLKQQQKNLFRYSQLSVNVGVWSTGILLRGSFMYVCLLRYLCCLLPFHNWWSAGSLQFCKLPVSSDSSQTSKITQEQSRSIALKEKMSGWTTLHSFWQNLHFYYPYYLCHCSAFSFHFSLLSFSFQTFIFTLSHLLSLLWCYYNSLLFAPCLLPAPSLTPTDFLSRYSFLLVLILLSL